MTEVSGSVGIPVETASMGERLPHVSRSESHPCNSSVQSYQEPWRPTLSSNHLTLQTTAIRAHELSGLLLIYEYMAKNQLADRTAIVTGGASGIGRSTARRFAKEGANVIIADVDEDGASEAVDELGNGGGVAESIPTDVTDADSVAALVEATVEKFDSVDILVNNAGGTINDDNIHRIDEETFDRNLELNLKAAFLCSRAVIPEMVARDGGSLVHISSVNGLFGIGNTGYTAAKGGLIPFSKLIANQYGRHGIRSNVICPGEIATAAHPYTDNDEIVTEWLNQFPLGRFGQPEEIASVALFLASEEASYVSGAEIVADGAMTAGPDQKLEMLSHRIDEV